MPNASQFFERAKDVQTRFLPSSRRRVPSTATHGEQRILAQQYRAAVAAGTPLPEFSEAEFSNHSQNGEDGIVLLLATVLRLQHRRVVELGAADGIESNSANLILHHGWSGLLIDGNEEFVKRGRQFYATQPETHRVGPTFVHSWITRDNVRALLTDNDYGRDVDVLSVDIDGVDLWVLQAIEPSANVLVVEFNNRLPADVALSVPYQESFSAPGDRMRGEGYFGASLQAFVNMLRPFGYRLVGANSVSTNAFFVREGVGGDILREVSAATCQLALWARMQSDRWWPILKTREWVEVL